MLAPHQPEPSLVEARNRRRERKLWERPHLGPSLGCPSCPQFGICGGLHAEAGPFDCMGHCCGSPETCTKMCRLKAHDFALKMREIGGFGLENIPRAPLLGVPPLPAVAPLIYHGNRRERFYTGAAVALSLHRLLHRATGEPKFNTEADLRAEFKISPETLIILSGTDQDPPLERWWAYGGAMRAEAIRALKSLGISLVTTPNYSLFANNPRWDDLHSMKRIGLVNDEFLQAGLPCALHVNARSDKDSERWIAFVAERPEITHIAYEFATGSGRAGRWKTHAQWLVDLAKRVDRPLAIVVRGAIEPLPTLSAAFDHVIYLETSAFMKTMKRQRAHLSGNAGIKWEPVPTPAHAALDDLFDHNVRLTAELVQLVGAPTLEGERVAAA